MTTQSLTTTAAPAARRFALDTEHAGIRFLMPILSIGTFLTLYVGINALSNEQVQEYIGCAAFAAAVVGAAAVAFLADRILKRVWPSPKHLSIDERGVTYHDKRNPDADINLRLGERINAVTWRFTVKRGSARVQRGWEMLGLQLTQDETRLTLYTFIAPKQVPTLRGQERFTPLVQRSLLEKGDIPLREAAQQRRLLAAEDERWRDGAEVERQHFEALLETLAPHVADWQ
jgi:hypothetical protein